MRILRHLHDCPDDARHSVVALGNFDGVHAGHREVIRRACALAKEYGTQAAVMTFEPHPVHVLGKKDTYFRIDTFHEKAEKLAALGIDILFAQPFNETFSKVPAEEFIERILVRNLAVRHVITGENFIFGYKRSGNTALLAESASHYGFEVTAVSPVGIGEDICSSTKVREALSQGDIKKTTALLEQPYYISGRVQRGESRGKKLGFPTANISLKHRLRPAFGVYAVYVSVEGDTRKYTGVANIGRKPTFGQFQELLEVHVFDANLALYGKRIRVYFIDYIRPERKFDQVESLIEQITKDTQMAKEILMHGKEPSCSLEG